MLYIECIDKTNCNVLEVGKLYYGFPTGGGALYVSRFPREGSHMGAYQRSRFNILTEEDFIAKKEALEVKPLALVREKLEKEVALENECNIEVASEAEQVIEKVVEEASVDVVEVSDVKKKTLKSIALEKVYRYQYIGSHSNRVYDVYGFINSIGKAVLYKDEALTMLIGVTSRENVIIISELGKEIDLKEYPVFMKAIKYGDMEGVFYVENARKVEVVQEGVTNEWDLTEEEISSAEVPLVDDEQKKIVKTELQERIVVESDKKIEEDEYEQLSIFDF